MQAPTDTKYLYKIYAGSVDASATAIPSTETDKKDGYIHLSTSAQLVGTLTKWFVGVDSITLMKIPMEKVQHKIKWEQAGRGIFAHIYDDSTDLKTEYVQETRTFNKSDSWEFLNNDKWIE